MRLAIDAVLDQSHRVAARAELLAVVTRNQLDDEVARRLLVAPFPRVYCRPWDADQSPVRDRAALLSVGPPVALSHLTALRRWGLPAPATAQIHVTVPYRRHPIGRIPELTVHRTRVATQVRHTGGLLTVAPAVAVVASWPLLTGADQRAPAISAVRNRIVTPAELSTVAARAVGMAGRSRLNRLIGQLEAGCESELGLWGYLGVFAVQGLRHGVRQRVVRVAGINYRLDLAFEEERVGVELDGWAFHSSRRQRERDMRRDAALATAGWQTLRFSHRRLHDDAHGCRRDTLSTLASRSAWLRSG